MATRKTTSKTSKKVEVDFNLNQPNKKTKSKLKKQMKKIGTGTMILLVFLVGIGGIGGYFGCKYITQNDCFTLNGKDELTLQLNEKYFDEGAKVIAFGLDDSKKVEVETNLTKNEDGSYSADEIGTYYMIYTVKNIKYGTIFKVQKIRLISFVEPSEGGSND